METESSSATTQPPGTPVPVRRLHKSSNDRVIAGVAGGLGEYFGVDAVLFRIGFVALTVAGGSGLALYGLAWLLLPEAGSEESAGERISRWFHHKPVLAIIGTVIAINIVANGFWWGGRWGHDNDGVWGVVLVALGVALFVNRRNSGGTGEPAPPPSAPPSDTPTQPDLDATDPLLAEAAALDPMAGTTGSSSIWPPPPGYSYAPPPPRPPRPRPFLTPVALSVLLIGGGVAALFGASLQAFLALALLWVGAVMLVGSRFGRARGLLAVGLLLAAMSTAASVTDVSLAGGTGQRALHPVSTTQLRPYRLGVGELTIDLTDLEFTGTRTVKARVGMGQLTVYVPSDVDVVAETHVGLGQASAFGQSSEGGDVDRIFNFKSPTESARQLRLDLDAGFGEINVEVR